MSKEELIEEISELINIPEFEEIIIHKIEELKELLKDKITLYKITKSENQSDASGNLSVCEEDGKERNFTYRFELDRTEDGDWVPKIIDPPPPYHNKYEIVPVEVIQYISRFTPNPTKVEKVKEFTSPQQKGKMYELSFTRYTHHHALGTICEIKRKKAPKPRKFPKRSIIDTQGSYKKETGDGNYRVFMFYMERFPKFKAHQFSEFFMKWKPLIDNHMIKETNDQLE
jgi:hypothetical protein